MSRLYDRAAGGRQPLNAARPHREGKTTDEVCAEFVDALTVDVSQALKLRAKPVTRRRPARSRRRRCRDQQGTRQRTLRCRHRIALSPDRQTLYVSDTLGYDVTAYAIGSDGGLEDAAAPEWVAEFDGFPTVSASTPPATSS